MLRQIEWQEQNVYIAKNGVLPVTTSFFEKKNSVQEPSVKSWFDVPTTQMPIFVLLVRAGVLFDGAFSLSILKEILQLQMQLTCSIFNKHYCKDNNHRYINNW